MQTRELQALALHGRRHKMEGDVDKPNEQYNPLVIAVVRNYT